MRILLDIEVSGRSFTSDEERARGLEPALQAALWRHGMKLVEARLMPVVSENTDGLVSRRHHSTAKQAALDVRPRTGSQRSRILMLVESAGMTGLSRDEIATGLKLSPNSVRPRVKELLDGDHLFVAPFTRMGDLGNIVEVLVSSRLRR